MKRTGALYSKLLVSSFILFSIIACQEDFTSIGGDIINNPNFDFNLYDQATVVAYSRRANPVQTNNLPVYQLGVFNDPIYGTSEASILSQVTLSQINPSFGDNPTIKKVILSIPYFSTATQSQDTTSYKLDSLYGNEPIQLAIYESQFLLRDFDPSTGFDEPQKYYSNQGSQFQNFLGQKIYETANFLPSSDPITLNPDTDEEEVLTPRLRLEFDENQQTILDFFKEKIIDQEGTDALLSNANFKNHFRGLYFIAKTNNNNGNLILLNLDEASIEIVYERDDPNGDNQENATNTVNSKQAEREEASFDLNFNGIRVNTFNNNIPPELQTALNNPNLEGAENLYVKGGGGSTMTVIELFGKDLNNNNIADELEDLRDKEWIINEANIILQVNKNFITENHAEPERIFLYDLNNNNVLIDYIQDNNTTTTDLLNFKTSHLGRLQRDASNVGDSYTLKITNHISNLINRDSTNVRLGLVVSPNVNLVSSQSLLNDIPPGVDAYPAAGVISPEGTVLHGTNNPLEPEKRIKLNIFYTEINN